MAGPSAQRTKTRRGGKSAAAFRTISEVAGELDLPQHVLRFWETKFLQVKPMKRGGGRRYYRPEDVRLLKRIRDLLYTDGYTIKGVQKLLRDERGRGQPNEAAKSPDDAAGNAAADGGAEGENQRLRGELAAVLAELEALREILAKSSA